MGIFYFFISFFYSFVYLFSNNHHDHCHTTTTDNNHYNDNHYLHNYSHRHMPNASLRDSEDKQGTGLEMHLCLKPY